MEGGGKKESRQEAMRLGSQGAWNRQEGYKDEGEGEREE